ncbi:MAG: hypothetical protein KF886_26855 [Candidatus Hydrogenedentes bacterium]|nr:hypothetical protein [Candidatus Hydrogenedentota bacterium]
MRSTAVILLAAMFLSGCLVDVLTSTAIQGELQAQQASAAKNTLDRVETDTAQTNLQRAVDLFHAEKGVYPPSLDVLAPAYINPIPTRADGAPFGYDPMAGKVLRESTGIDPADYATMEHIRNAIIAYGTRTGFYPDTLDTLAQAGLLPAPPRTAAGEPFLYNNQTGLVQHPRATGGGMAAAPRAGGGVPAGGGGLMGEAMTGIAIQEELNRSSNAGSAAAGTRGRTGARGAAATQDERQQRALDELGF